MGDQFHAPSTAQALTTLVPGTSATSSHQLVQRLVVSACLQTPLVRHHTAATSTLSLAVPFTLKTALLQSWFGVGEVMARLGLLLSITRVALELMTPP